MFGRRRDKGGARGEDSRSRDFAWRVHTAQETWTAKVDAKASIVFALQGAVLVTVVAASAGDGVFAALSECRLALLVVGVLCTLASAACAGAVVFPLLGSSSDHERDHRDNFIYFGHLRHWQDPRALADRLGRLSADEELEQLARQLTAMGRLNWVKHRRLQKAVVLGLLGVTLVVAPVVWP